MKIGILVTARLGSSRLRRKHLLPVADEPLISYLLARIAFEFSQEITSGIVTTIIASSDEPENRDFERLTTSGVQTFFGASDNIPLRHLQAAEKFDLDAIIAVDGDDILCSVRAMRSVYNALSAGKQYVRTTGLPFGMNTFGYSTDFLASSLAEYHEAVLETGWGKIFTEVSVTEIQFTAPAAEDRLRFTLDYEEDYWFFSAVIEAIGPEIVTANDDEITWVVEQNSFYHINQNIAQEYWANFRRCMEREKGSKRGS